MPTIAEELVLAATDEEGRTLLSSNRDVAIAGAFLGELAVRERLSIDERKRLRVVPGGSTGDPLLDRALELFAERAGRKPKDVLPRVGQRLRDPVHEALVRRELVRPRPVRVGGLTLSTRWPVLDPAVRDALLDDLVQVLTGAREVDARTGALISLLHAVDALPRVLRKELRPGLTNRDVRRRGKEVLQGRWASEAVVTAVQEAAGATAAVVAAGGAVAGSS